jgi:hypothetical protein
MITATVCLDNPRWQEFCIEMSKMSTVMQLAGLRWWVVFGRIPGPPRRDRLVQVEHWLHLMVTDGRIEEPNKDLPLTLQCKRAVIKW